MTESGWIDLVWTDLVGRARVIRAPRDAVEASDVTVSESEVTKGFAHHDERVGPALRLVPDMSTERALPWESGVSVVMADLYEADAPSRLCSRSFLRDRAVAGAASDGYEVVSAAELEFYVIDPASGLPPYDYVDNYNLARVECEPVLTDIRETLREMGVGIEASNPEYSGGQFEVNIRHAECLEAADQATLLRLYVGVIAARRGWDATFLAKPWTEGSGSGMHIHQSLWREGENVFFGGPDELSTEGFGYLAGLLSSLREFALLGSPTPNGYHRRADESFAPTSVSWATDNRTAAVRVVLGDEESTRIEHRDSGADCNIYLATGGQILAGLEGIRGQLEPPPAITGNAYAQELPPLPRTFLEAYESFAQSQLVRKLVPEQLASAYLEALAPEVELLITSVGEWERERYAEVPLR